MRASSICGGDIRAIYREHTGRGAEGYRGVIAGHEPCGQVVKVGPGVRDLRVDDRVVVYHIGGCGLCEECRRGYPIGCESEARAAYGWQRDGGHADYLLADEVSCLALPESLTHVDGALVSCGFATVYQGLLRARTSGCDRLLVTGLGPVGLAAAPLGRALGASLVIGSDPAPERVALATSLGVVDAAAQSPEELDELDELVAVHTSGRGCEVRIDCSGNAAASESAVRNTRTSGSCVFVGEGGTVTLSVSELLIHKQLTVHGSWVSSVDHMRELLEKLAPWDLHPEQIVTDRYLLSEADEAYRVADVGTSGKVCIVWED